MVSESVASITEALVVDTVSAVLYGMLVLMCCTSVYSLIRHNNRRARRANLVLNLTLLVLLASTTTYTVAGLLRTKQYVVFLLGDLGVLEYSAISQACDCAKTAALTVNILLGDAIVCWRAYAVWRGNRVITGTSIALLLTTLALGIVDTQYDCVSLTNHPNPWQPDPKATGSGALYEGFSYGVAATVLSLCTNLYATAAVAFKAWQSRGTLKAYFMKGQVSRTGKVLSLLVESGAIYCAIWIPVVVYQVGTYTRSPGPGLSPDKYYRSFWYIFGFIVKSSLVPLIAIYPTSIVILVAFNRSHIEGGFAAANVSVLPLRPRTIAVDTTVGTMSSSSRERGSPETMLVVDERGFVSGERLEGASTYSYEERKLGDAV